MTLQAPFPWFGGKSRVADLVWQRFGDVPNYVEPFAGSLAVLLARPSAPGIETVNDKDAFLCNFWRAIQFNPHVVAEHALNPVNESDLHARHAWLVAEAESLRERIEGNPAWCNPQIAGWWAWGLCCWIGSGWCSGAGPWGIETDETGSDALRRVDSGEGGIARKRPHLMSAKGVNRRLPHLGDAGKGEYDRRKAVLVEWFSELRDRLINVRVSCGDWRECVRVLSPRRRTDSPAFSWTRHTAQRRAATTTCIGARTPVWRMTCANGPSIMVMIR